MDMSCLFALTPIRMTKVDKINECRIISGGVGMRINQFKRLKDEDGLKI